MAGVFRDVAQGVPNLAVSQSAQTVSCLANVDLAGLAEPAGHRLIKPSLVLFRNVHKHVKVFPITSGPIGFPCPDEDASELVIARKLGELVQERLAIVASRLWRAIVKFLGLERDQPGDPRPGFTGKVPGLVQIANNGGAKRTRNGLPADLPLARPVSLRSVGHVCPEELLCTG
jgi:hypothetical protein